MRATHPIFEQLRRDVRMVVNDLLGRHPAPFTPRAPLARHHGTIAPKSANALLAPRTLRVTRVVRETPDAISIHLADPAGAPISFTPGQFFTVLVAIPGGEALRRAYSICTAPDAEGRAAEVAITIKRVAGGRASNHLNDNVREGDLLEVLGPSGSFTIATDTAARRHYVLLGGGSGITPLMSIARAALAREPGAHVSLVYGNRGEADIIFREALAALAAEHPERFTLRHVLSDPPAGWPSRTGILDRATVEAELAELPASNAFAAAATDYFICGPEPMMAAAREAVLARGVDPARVHEERFSSPAQRAPVARPASAQPITILHRGAPHRVNAAAGQTILEAGLAAGLPMPFSCGLGGCGACKVKLGAGAVDSEEPNCLSAAERENGYVLACVSRAAEPVTVEIG